MNTPFYKVILGQLITVIPKTKETTDKLINKDWKQTVKEAESFNEDMQEDTDNNTEDYLY